MSDQATTMAFEASEAESETTVQVAPLVDIVFLLICFFMLTTQLVQVQKDPAVRLPVMVSPGAETEKPAEVTVNLRADGVLTIEGRSLALSEVGGVLAAEESRAREAGQALRVVVRADRRQRFGRLDALLETCREAGLSQVVFRAEGEARP